ncbi:MAG TPA: amidohydrolase family protein [bacterium]|nr:amidohydrolase family protein [bacterium]
MKTIDVHTHIFPDHVALNAVPKMAEEAGVPYALDGRVDSLRQSMDQAEIAVSWLQPVATRAAQVESINRWHEELRNERLVAFGAIHPDYPDLPGLIRDLSRRGFPGIKIHPEYHKIPPDDERLFPLYEAVGEENLIILFHAGVDIGIPTLNSTPRQFARLHDRFPGLRMILAHMGGFKQWEAVNTDIAGRDIYFDTSYVFGHIDDAAFVDLVRRHGPERILFGTDSPWAGQKETLNHLKSLPLSDEELEGICWKNAARLIDPTR